MQHAETNTLEPASVSLVLGGVRSGKSRYAQRLAERWSRVIFVATARARDDEEMQRKIARHQSDRPSAWTTIEEPVSLGSALQEAALHSDAILVDCLTLFSANLLEIHGDDEHSVQAQIESLCHVLEAPRTNIILVSNEVGSGVVPAYASGRRFRDLAGEINQRVAAVADTVYLMIAGIPIVLKVPKMEVRS